MLEKLQGRGAKAGAPPDIAKTASKLPKVGDEYRRIQRTTKRTANKSGRGFWARVDGLPHRRDFGDRNPVVNCI